jgi:glycosyltransferase involved in cell wall biosynthesis
MHPVLESSSEGVVQKSKRRTSIVILVPGFPGSEAETDCLPPVQNFVKAIARRNPDVEINVVSLQYPFSAGTYTWNGAIVHAMAGRNKRFPLRFRSWLQAAWCVRHLMKSRDVVALHSFWLAECTYVAAQVARMTGTKHIATICGQDALSENPYLKHLRFDEMTITAKSQTAAEAFRKSTGRDVDHVIPTGLDLEALAVSVETAERSIDLLGVGSLTPIKDFRSFLKIVNAVKQHYPSLRCAIIGEGPERFSLEREIKEEKLQDNVRLTGHLRRDEVLQNMRRARILLHTSRYEGQGYVFLEALASGMRVVCRDVGYTGSGTGAFRCKSSEEMVDVVRRLLLLPHESAAVSVESIDCTALAFEGIYGIG